MQIEGRRDIVFILLAGIFISNALMAEIIGVKLIQLGPFVMTVGVFCWPVVFVTTDLINEYFGVKGVRRLTLLTMGLIVYMFVVTFIAMAVPAAPFSPVNDEVYGQVFGQSQWIIIGSLTAFAVSQIVDVMIFWFFRDRTQGRLLWLRATGSTVVSQLIDTFIIIGIAFWAPGKITFAEYMRVSGSNYAYKLIIAICMTPIIYLVHHLIDRFLGREESQRLMALAAREHQNKS